MKETKKILIKIEILRLLERKQDFIKGDEICAELCDFKSVNTSEVRAAVNSLRNEGYPIISSSQGYKLSNDPDEIEKQIKSYLKRITKMNHALQGLKKTKDRIIREQEFQRKYSYQNRSSINAELFLAENED